MSHNDLLSDGIGQHLLKVRNNYFSSVENPKPGICGALAARWIRRGLEKKVALDSEEALGRIFKAVELQKKTLESNKKGEGDHEKILLSSQRLTFTQVKNKEFKTWDDAAKGLSGKTGFFYYSASSVDAGGHAMAIHISPDGKQCLFFDPNYGVYGYAKLDDLIAAVRKNLSSYKWLQGGKEQSHSLYHVTEVSPKEKDAEQAAKKPLKQVAVDCEPIALSFRPVLVKNKENLTKEFPRYESAVVTFWLSRYLKIKNGKEKKEVINKFKPEDLKQVESIIEAMKKLQSEKRDDLNKIVDKQTNTKEESILHGLLSAIGLKHEQSKLQGIIEYTPEDEDEETPDEVYDPICKNLSSFKSATGCFLLMTPDKCTLVCVPQNGLPGYYTRSKSIMESSAEQFWAALADHLTSSPFSGGKLPYSIHEIKEV